MNYKIGQKLRGKVTGIQPYGAFVMLNNHQQGLIHISECKSGVVKNLANELAVGKEVDVVVLDIEQYNGKISLSLRQSQMQRHDNQLPVKYHNIRKRYWTNYHLEYGFTSIANKQGEWITEALDRI